ncbi:hypothetical protein ABTY20_03965 [Streptomyces sp. NPDC126497]|uniref:hypothetical protein n=1 Tax=Streptomyces sp. NPDC126497 TaxID=3155313 RepID=UPI00332039AB
MQPTRVSVSIALVDLHLAAEEGPGRVRLADIPPAVQDVLRFSGLDTFFNCCSTVEHALTV